mmetsp:Transcript_125327/g.217270  ORF Transcript_125327/g.217270 Transcript_125327/m.217270 type:complete len:223 (+) Transcript_125327:1096-1764(+)
MDCSSTFPVGSIKRLTTGRDTMSPGTAWMMPPDCWKCFRYELQDPCSIELTVLNRLEPNSFSSAISLCFSSATSTVSQFTACSSFMRCRSRTAMPRPATSWSIFSSQRGKRGNLVMRVARMVNVWLGSVRSDAPMGTTTSASASSFMTSDFVARALALLGSGPSMGSISVAARINSSGPTTPGTRYATLSSVSFFRTFSSGEHQSTDLVRGTFFGMLWLCWG